MRTIDPDVKSWSPPFCEQVASIEGINCNGKNIADCVESLLGAHFMSNNLRKTLQLISDIKLVPMKQAHLLDMIPDKDLTFVLGADIDAYEFTMNDSVEDIFRKYFKVQQIPLEVQDRIMREVIGKDIKTGAFGEITLEFVARDEDEIRNLG